MKGVLRSRAGLVAVIGGAALAIAVALVVVSQVGKDDPKAVATLAGAAEVNALLDGIPQSGNVLGNATAPVTLIEYADMQCPYCAQWSRDAFPDIVRDYVRPGKVRMVFRGMAFIGPDSTSALRTVLAAGEQNRLWHMVDLTFLNQGTENSGWADDSFLRAAATASGLDADATLERAKSPAVLAAVAEHAELAAAAGINSTPSFELGKTGGAMTRIELTGLDAAAMRPALDAALAE